MDLVLLIAGENIGDKCGRGALPTSPDPATGFAVVRRSCALTNLSHSHEVGHNLGMNHDRYVVEHPSDTGYNYGFVLKEANMRDIMAYADACEAEHQHCKRMPYFSSPDGKVTAKVNGRKETFSLGIAAGQKMGSTG